MAGATQTVVQSELQLNHYLSTRRGYRKILIIQKIVKLIFPTCEYLYLKMNIRWVFITTLA